jgi:hypothetical protein
MEIASHPWYPDIAIPAVSDPSAVRPQGIVEQLDAYSALVIVIVVAVVVLIAIVRALGICATM